MTTYFVNTQDTEAEHKKDDDKPQEGDVNNSSIHSSSLIEESKEVENKLEENQDNISENKEHDTIKNDTSDESRLSEPPCANENDEDETYEKMVTIYIIP